MARPEPPFYVGTTRPGTVGWFRVGINALCGVIMVVALLTTIAPGQYLLATVAAIGFGLLTLWSWMRLSTRFIVDERGLTVSWGGFMPRATWPVANFRTVQLREIPAETLGVTAGGVGWRRTRVMTAKRADITPVGSRKAFTLATMEEPYRMMISRPGTMVEIIGREGEHYLISPVDPHQTAQAVDQAIRARR